MPNQFTAMLHVHDCAAARDFYQRAFGASILWAAPNDGTVVQFSVDGAEFWIHQQSTQYSNFGPQMLGGTTVRLILVVPDPDALFDRAIAAGATSIRPVQDHDYGWRDGRLADPFGHHWEIGHPLT